MKYSHAMKAIARLLLYGVGLVAVVLLVLRTTNRPTDRFMGPVTVANHARGPGPVRISYYPTPTHPPFVAPTPYVPPLLSASVAQLMSAARSGDAAARCELGKRYADGNGVEKNPVAARALFQLAADQKNACGVSNLGNFAYDAGDYAAASHYFHAAADLGYPVAFFNLGQVAKWGPQRDNVEAYKWYKAAAMRGYITAYDFVGTGMLAGYDENVRDPWLAEQWDLLGAKAGDKGAMEDLAWYYTYRSKELDRYKQAMFWLRKSACACSDYAIGRLYAKGLGVPKDIREAGRWYKRAAEQQYAPAQAAYGDLLRLGELGRAPDPKAALPYYLNAAEQGNGDAMYAMAEMTERGVGVPRDAAKAASMYAAAAAHCSGDALFRLAQLRATGSAGLPKDVNRSMALAMVSIFCGEDDAHINAFLAKPHAIVDGAKINRYVAEYESVISDYTGDPDFAPRASLPPISSEHQSSI